MKEAYGCFICGHIVKEHQIVRVFMAGCTNGATDFVHICKSCVVGVNAGEVSLPNSSAANEDDDTPEQQEKRKNTVNKLLEDVDLSKLDNKNIKSKKEQRDKQK